jgi:hypothetical protein
LRDSGILDDAKDIATEITLRGERIHSCINFDALNATSDLPSHTFLKSGQIVCVLVPRDAGRYFLQDSGIAQELSEIFSDEGYVDIHWVPTVNSPPNTHIFLRHMTWNDLMQRGLVNQNMQCIATIRHPVDRFLSAVSHYLFLDHATQGVENSGDAYNNFWDRFMSCPEKLTRHAETNDEDFDHAVCLFKSFLGKKQTDFLSDQAIVWQSKNFAPQITALVEQCGGTITGIPHVRKFDRPPRDALLTKDRQQQILEFYQDDFILWEKAT